MERTLLIFGSVGTASEIKEIVETYYEGDYENVILVWYKKGWELDDIYASKIKNTQVFGIIGFSDIEMRKECIASLKGLNIELRSVHHPTADVASSAVLGSGVYLAAHTTISSKAILSDNIIVNYNASIGHDANLSENCIILPGARISGNVILEEGVLVGSNAFLFQGIRIGANSSIDALTYVRTNLEKDTFVSIRGNRKINKKIN